MLYNALNFKMVTGCGRGRTELNAFDNALQNAGVGNYNLIRVSSILPPFCKESNDLDVQQGSVLPIAYSTINSSHMGDEIVAVIGVGIPTDSTSVGVIMEYSAVNSPVDAERTVKQMVEDAMKNRNIQVADVLLKSCRNTVHDDHECVFAAVALW